MGISLDHVGLNTLIADSASFSMNTLGFSGSEGTGSYINTRIVQIQGPNNGDSAKVAAGIYAEYLIGLNTTRNGPYGFPTWKQVRISDNPITKNHNKNSDLTFYTQPGEILTDEDGIQVGRDSRSSLFRFKEPIVTKKTQPLVWRIGNWTTVTNIDGEDEIGALSYTLKASLGDGYFSNSRVDELLLYQAQQNAYNPYIQYAQIKRLYLDGALEAPGSPIDYFESLRYKETVYPKSRNMFRKEINSRPSFTSFFRRDRKLRTKGVPTSSFGFSTTQIDELTRLDLVQLSQSTWPLDPSEDFLTRTKPSTYINAAGTAVAGGAYEPFFLPIYDAKGNSGAGADLFFTPSTVSSGGAGILFNNYSQHLLMDNPISGNFQFTPDIFDAYLGVAPYYSRRHTLANTQSVSNPTGMKIPETGSLALCKFGGGETIWEAGAGAGEWVYREPTPAELIFGLGQSTRIFTTTSKTPAADTYAEFSRDHRVKAKNYSVLPEFRISEHIQSYENAGTSHIPSTMFEVSGGGDNNNSSFDDFYITYSHSDFMKHFDLISADHSTFASNQTLTLTCKVVKKFLAYEGFYPCQRTTQMAEAFYASYGDNIEASWGQGEFGWGDGGYLNSVNVLEQIKDAKFAKQYVLTPLFAPGVLFNTIKSGVACDYPVVTTTLSTVTATGSGPTDQLTTNTFNTSDRVPFEALLEPEAYLANKLIHGPEPHTSGNMKTAATWDGGGQGLYKKMANNFLSEVPEFFLKDSQLTRFVSKRQGDPTFGNQVQDKVYGMRISMYRTMNSPPQPVSSSDGNSTSYLVPQDLLTGSLNENMTMYSRPSSFGPPSFGFTTLSASHFGGKFESAGNNVTVGQHINRSDDLKFWELSGAKILYERDSRHGYNFPYTPPYYHGQAWIDVFYTGSSDTSNATVNEILNAISASFIRFDPEYLYPPGQSIQNTGPQSLYKINENAMQLSASVLFRGSLQASDDSRVTPSLTPADDNRWVIQTKFETPILNFNHITASVSTDSTFDPDYAGYLSIPAFASESVARGMWHQYGRIPDVNEGVYLNVGPIPTAWMSVHHPQHSWDDSNNLATLAGFSQDSKRLGELADTKTIGEAVVAVPFVLNGNVKEFLSLDPNLVQGYVQQGQSTSLAATITDQIDKMRRYVFPPTFDFVAYPSVPPFAMYIFEFEHILLKKDLQDIWQNLPPDIGTTYETAEASITHPLLDIEMLGGAAFATSPVDNVPHSLPSQLRWMVFKVKRKATSDYFSKIIAENASAAFPVPTAPVPTIGHATFPGTNPNSNINRGSTSWPNFVQSATQVSNLSGVAGIGTRGALGLGSPFTPTNETLPGGAGAETNIFEDTDPVQFNWPYDYFSLIELASLDAEILFQPTNPVVAPEAGNSEQQDSEQPEDVFNDQNDTVEYGSEDDVYGDSTAVETGGATGTETGGTVFDTWTSYMETRFNFHLSDTGSAETAAMRALVDILEEYPEVRNNEAFNEWYADWYDLKRTSAYLIPGTTGVASGIELVVNQSLLQQMKDEYDELLDWWRSHLGVGSAFEAHANSYERIREDYNFPESTSDFNLTQQEFHVWATDQANQ